MQVQPSLERLAQFSLSTIFAAIPQIRVLQVKLLILNFID